MFYLDLFRTLSEERVRYVLIGGLAVNLHGAERLTMDVDLLLAMDDVNLGRFLAVARRLSLKPVLPVTLEQFCDAPTLEGWIRDKRMLAFQLRSPEPAAPSVDILVKPGIPFDLAYDRRVKFEVEGVIIEVAAIEDLVALKSGTGRLIDESDIRALQRIAELRNRETR